ncbi:hypothetical protein BN7_1786 [Wickerhamomyces ciferrii]|uniref:Rab-GAP TBC domain-containing protein n=1 Tax=Wickerhamomyces ciferrii (strain ATCC 14091 / BCRC 22168 / CBS 111 / JCM 3599 / NBRC 0793 / NRRL Y-1031 F-60-10) TaxID=1206466 RepID=K0KJE2_WICCF|nr:uncharacterized protein BN7_1786 [Wickerhamomyces ciferrii]CCH42242.1 hypothetical protein BN7_1786 [Wickerhamomyces ciferrii]
MEQSISRTSNSSNITSTSTTSTTSTNTTNSNTSSSPSSPSLNNHITNTPATNKKIQKLHTLQIDTKNLIQLCNQFIKENNHLGLSLIARQKGIPPQLRHKVWPILLKYHPYVINPYLTSNVDDDSQSEIPEGKIKHELLKYFRIRNSKDQDSNNSGSSSPDQTTSPLEEEIIRILEFAIIKFFKKWGKIIKYDSGFTWIALGLAEWFPPIPNSDYILTGRDSLNKEDSINKHVTQLSNLYPSFLNKDDFDSFSLDNGNHDYLTNDSASDKSQETTTSSTTTQQQQHTTTNSMTFAEVYERLVLVLLHSNENDDEMDQVVNRPDDQIEENTVDLISSNKLNMMELVFKSGNIESRISFFLLAFAKLLPELYKGFSEEEILNSNSNKNNQWLTWWLKYCGAKVLNKFDRGRLWDLLLGFRLSYTNFGAKYYDNPKLLKRFKKFYNDDDLKFDNELDVVFNTDSFWYKPSTDTKNELKWSQIDYQIQLVFIYISILQKNEHKLLEFDQFEIQEFLNKVKNNGYKDKNNENNDLSLNDEFDKILNEAGELWRNWLWNEIRDEINE